MVFLYEVLDVTHNTDRQVFYFNITDVKLKNNKSYEHITPISYSR